MLAWGRIEHIRFGPITDKQRFDRLVFYPDPRGIAARQIDRLLKRRDESALAPQRLAGASVGIQGFAAIDRVLFGKGSDTLGSPSGDGFRCRYVQALAKGVAQIAAETLRQWAGPFGRTWLGPGKGNGAFLTAKETTQALFRSYVTELGVVRLQRLVPMLGGSGKAGGPAPPLFPDSRLGLPYLLANIEGARELLDPERLHRSGAGQGRQGERGDAALGERRHRLELCRTRGEQRACRRRPTRWPTQRRAPSSRPCCSRSRTRRRRAAPRSATSPACRSASTPSTATEGGLVRVSYCAEAAVLRVWNLPDMSTTGCWPAVDSFFTSLASRSNWLRSTMRMRLVVVGLEVEAQRLRIRASS